jgi:hypothetical protein
VRRVLSGSKQAGVEFIEVDHLRHLLANIPFLARSALNEAVKDMNQKMEDVWNDRGPGWAENSQLTKDMVAAATGLSAEEKEIYEGVLGALGDGSSLLATVGVGEGKDHARMVQGAHFDASGGSIDYAWPQTPHEDGRGLTIAEIALANEVGFTATLPNGAEAQVPARPWLTYAADRVEDSKMEAMALDVSESLALYDVAGSFAANLSSFLAGRRQP